MTTSQQAADLLLQEHQENRGRKMNSLSGLLASIEAKAAWIARDGQSLAEFVAMLSARRNFETMAEAAIDDAERALIDALKVVRASRAAYNAKPLENDRAA